MPKPTVTTDVFDKLTDDSIEDAVEPERAVTPNEDGVLDDPTESTADSAPPGRLRRRILTTLIGVVMLASLGSAAYFGWRVKQLDDTAAAGRAALTDARDYAAVLTTLDSKDIDKHYNQALDGATGEFKDQYSQGAAHLRQILIDNHAAGNGVVLDAAIKSATKTKVEVLLFVDQSITNAVNTNPRLDRNRVQMTMELVNGRWLASRVDII